MLQLMMLVHKCSTTHKQTLCSFAFDIYIDVQQAYRCSQEYVNLMILLLSCSTKMMNIFMRKTGSITAFFVRPSPKVNLVDDYYSIVPAISLFYVYIVVQSKNDHFLYDSLFLLVN